MRPMHSAWTKLAVLLSITGRPSSGGHATRGPPAGHGLGRRPASGPPLHRKSRGPRPPLGLECRAMTLDISPEDFRRVARGLAELAADYLATLDQLPIAPRATGAETD